MIALNTKENETNKKKRLLEGYLRATMSTYSDGPEDELTSFLD